MIAGYRTVRINEGIITQWLALDFECVPVKVRIDRGGGNFVEKQLISFTYGEPATDLFEVPPDDRERSPSERILRSDLKLENDGSAKRIEKMLREMDKAYQENRVRK